MTEKRDLLRVSQQEESFDDSGISDVAQVTSSRTSRKVKVAGVLMVLSVLAVAVGKSGHGLGRIDINSFVGLSTSHCADFNRIKLRQTLRTNLGLKGPQHSQPEGILYSASDYQAPDVNPIHLEVNVEGQAANGVFNYVPAYPSDNGIYGHFGDINLRGGNNVTLKFTALDTNNQPITIPEFDISFFDIDIGNSGGKNTTEAITIYKGWTAVHISSETQLVSTTSREDNSVTYQASMLGKSRDSPKDPEILTAWQFNKAVTVRYDNFASARITLHAYGPGTSGRYFNFILEPTILCVDAGVKPETIHSVVATEPPPPVEDKCCVLLFSPVELICTDKPSKKWFHFMCTNNAAESSEVTTAAPSDGDSAEEEEQACVIKIGPVKVACVAKKDKKWYHFM